jgi:hypothetical protein
MGVESLRQSRKGATVVFTAITRMKDKYRNSLFCCFEGDDSKYYFKRIEDKTGYSPEKIIALNCDGKKEVLRLYRLINEKSEYSDIKFLYFIDKDFDPPFENTVYGIYETPVYSVENFYTTLEAFVRILRCEFNYTEADPEYSSLLDLFKERQKEFHEKTLYFNAWLACQRDNSTKNNLVRLNLNNFKLSKIITIINLDRINAVYDKTLLESLFPEAIKLSDKEIDIKVNVFLKCIQQETFRGKFEIEFLNEILEAIKKEFSSDKPRLTKKKGVHLSQSKSNMISEFSQYASTSFCLISFLEKYKTA